ncbi:hypothetical protein Tco_0502327 [Tanacetum coccineum]
MVITTTSDSLTITTNIIIVPVLSLSPHTSPIRPLGYRAAMIRLRVEAASTSYLLPFPPPIIPSHTRPDAPPLGIPPLHPLSADRRADRPEVTLPPRKRLGITLGPREIMRDLERDVSYGITDTWDEMLVDMLGAPVTDDTEMGRRMTEFTTRVRQDTDEIYTKLDDEQGYVVTYSGGSTAGNDYRVIGNRPQEAGGDDRDASGKLQETEAVHRGTEAAEEASDSDDIVREIAGTRQRRMFPEESDKIEKYVGGLPDMIHGSVVESKPKTMQDAVEIATELMDKKIRTFVER